MKQLLEIEWMKIKSYKTFWIFMGLYLFLTLAWNMGLAYGLLNFNVNGISPIENSFSFPAVWGKITYIAGWLMVIPSILMITLVCNEFQFKTHRQNIIDGQSRMDFIYGKIILAVMLSVVIVLISFLAGLILGFTNGGGNPFENLRPLLFQFLYSINYLLFSILIALYVKKSGLSIALFFCYILFFENIVGFIINKYAKPIGNFFPLQVSDELLPIPFSDTVQQLSEQSQTSVSPWIYAAATLVYIGLYIFIARIKITKSDL